MDIIEPLVDALEVDYENMGYIEFSDMLSKGVQAVRNHKTDGQFRLILVDEFQDTARLKMALVNALANHPDLQSDSQKPIIFMVGDDWQTINRFSGSDVDIFKSYVSPASAKQNGIEYCEATEDGRLTHIVRLVETYRSAQGIADVARASVLKNTRQIDKEVKALNKETEDTIRIVPHLDNAEARQNALLGELEVIAKLSPICNKPDDRVSVFILTRNRKETVRPEGITKAYINQLTRQFKSRLVITHNTMHSSKGLEADYTILPGIDEGYKGFPSTMTNDPLFDLVLPFIEDPLEEERRLFYVALTRSKKRTIILTAATRPSRYVLEFREMSELRHHFDWVTLGGIKFDPVTCPSCQTGILVKKYSNVECTCYPICSYKIEATEHVDVVSEGELEEMVLKAATAECNI